MTTLPARAAIDKAQPLEFPEREKQANISIEIAPDGLHIRCEYTGTLGSIPAAIERLRAAGVLELVSGGKAAPVQSGAHTPARKPPQRVEPAYDGSGQAMCPVHRKPLSEGRYGPFCPSRAEGEHANAKGYCNIRFTD